MLSLYKKTTTNVTTFFDFCRCTHARTDSEVMCETFKRSRGFAALSRRGGALSVAREYIGAMCTRCAVAMPSCPGVSAFG